jgi:hypothetical protein
VRDDWDPLAGPGTVDAREALRLDLLRAFGIPREEWGLYPLREEAGRG